MSELVPKYKSFCVKINTSLKDILDINLKSGLIKVEPLVTMGQITNTLIPLGYTLPVVPELDSLTVAGLLMGFGVETSSHKYGLFQFICIQYEIITSEGNLLVCNK